MEKSICKIEFDTGECGNGFFCSIQFNDSYVIKVLITNNHIWKESNNFEKIKLIINDELKEIIIDKSRLKYINEEYGVNIIEIKDIDDIDKDIFLEIDSSNLNELISIYLLYYSEENKEIVKFYSKIQKIYENNIFEFDSNNLPDLILSPIINKNNNKIIGINICSRDKDDFNKKKGIFINKIIEEFKINKLYKIMNENDINLNNDDDLITIIYEIKGKEKIQLFGSKFVKNNNDKCSIFIFLF